MKNCFYPNATINGSHPGFTVWCEGDYVNCHKGDPSGASVSTSGLSLGAPSTCDSGWGTNSPYGGGNYGGYNEGNYGSGPVRCVYPNGAVLFCRNPHVDCSKTQGGPILTNREVSANGTTAQCDSVSGASNGSYDGNYNDEDYGNMEEWCNAKRSGTCRQTCDKYGMQNDPGCVKGCETMTESMCDGSYRGDRGGSKTCEQQCDEMESSFYSCTSNDPSPMCAGSISKCKRRCGRDSYHPASEDEGSYRGRDDEHSETYRRYDAPTNGTMSWGQCFAECSKGIPASDPRYEQCRRKCDGGGYQSPGMPSPQEWTDTAEPSENRWERQGMSERPQEEERAPGRDPTEMCKRMEAEARLHGDPAIQTEIRTLVEECYATVRKLMESGTPAESKMRDTMESFRWKFEKIMHSQWQRSACDDADRGIGEARSAITTFAPMMVRKVTASHPTIAKSLEGLLQKAHTILARAEKALKNDDCDAALEAMDEMDRNVRLPFEAAMKRAGISMDEGDGEYSLVNYENQYTEIYQRSGSTGEPDAGYEEFRRALEEKGYGLGDLNRLKTIDPKFMKLVAKDEGADVIKGSTGIDRANLEEILAAKDAVIAKLEEQVHSLQAGMATLVAGVARFTPHPSVAEKLEDLVQRASSLSPEQFREEFAAIDSETRTAAVEDGWTQFTDAYQFDPAQQWYAGPVNTMADEGIFNGVDPKNHVFGAGQEANGAELVTALARMVGMDRSAAPASAYANALPDWAQNAGGTLDLRLAGSLDDYLAGEAGRGVTRQEIARLIAGLFGDDLPEADSSVFEDFADTGDIPADVQENIAPVVSAGIITGQESDNGRAFDPHGTVTREQLATILSRVLPLLQKEEENDDVSVKRSLRRSLHEASGVKPDAMPSVVEEASSGLQFDLSAITKMETSAVYARILQEISNIKAVAKNATQEERLEIWVPKLNATTNAKNSWEKLNVSDFYQPYKNIPTWKMNIEGKLMDKDVRTIKNLILNPTKVTQ